jgi:NAD-dependent SIR2 family protein deacetylase
MRKPKPSDILLADLYDHRERGKCYTQEEIGEAVGCDHKTVHNVLGEMANLQKCTKSQQAQADHAADFEPPHDPLEPTGD